ncbi:hypothetical protein IAD21_00195 [Abditibacteriota bacterium]|nr:hypothetical protein IAD21_00195 [Abditibacteriota bacterium]
MHHVAETISAQSFDGKLMGGEGENEHRPTMNHRRGLEKLLWLYLVAFAAVSTATWRWYANNPPVASSDCTTMTGTLLSFAEMGTSKSPYLEFSIRESPAAFCVPMDGYRDSFDSSAFRNNARNGQKIWITARTHEIQMARSSINTPPSTVFVIGLRDSRTVYSTVAGRAKWERYNRQLGWDCAVAFTALTALYASALTA